MDVRGRAVAVAMLVAATACSSPQADGLAEGIPDLPGAGDEIAHGLVVPEDALLLLPLVPTSAPFEDDLAEVSWRAELWLDGDPTVVANDVLAQLRSRGMSTVASCSNGTCRVTGRRSAGDRVLEQVRLEVVRPEATLPAGFWRSSWLEYSRWPPPGAPHPNPVLEDAPDLPPTSLPPAAEPPDVPTDVFPAVYGVRLDIVDGSEVVAPLPDSDCEDGLLIAHLAVEDDVDEVVDGYEAQLDDLDWYRLERSEEEFLGDRVVVLRGEGPRIDRQHRDAPLELRVTEGEGDEPSWARLSWATPCTD